MKELSLYIHIPFCAQKCYYCDFLSFSMNEEGISKYFDALNKEIETYSMIVGDDYVIKSVFIGGGTPTSVDARYIVGLMKCIQKNFTILSDAEISIESNPATFDKYKLVNYKDVGINRLSIGLQCWQDDLLKSIGRIHTRQDFVNAFLEAKTVGFENINIDLIFNLPNQTFEDWEETIEEVCRLDPTHLSCYSLKIEEGTALYKRAQEKKFILDEDLDRKMYHYAINTLKNMEYVQYEISNFSKPNFECKHNMVYWELGDYIGLGLGSHSYFKGYRYSNEENIKDYVQNLQNGKPIIRDKILVSKYHMKEEFIFLGLRKIKGIQEETYRHIFHDDIYNDFGDCIKKMSKDDYIIAKNGNIRLSKKGLDFANYVFMSFLT